MLFTSLKFAREVEAVGRVDRSAAGASRIEGTRQSRRHVVAVLRPAVFESAAAGVRHVVARLGQNCF
jgi:hypothetical protein